MYWPTIGIAAPVLSFTVACVSCLAVGISEYIAVDSWAKGVEAGSHEWDVLWVGGNDGSEMTNALPKDYQVESRLC